LGAGQFQKLLEEQREAQKFSRFINSNMRIDPIVTTAISTSQNIQNNRVETVRRQYVDVGGRMEIRETYYYYYIYDRKGQVEQTRPRAQVDIQA
jgi:hypothetical protein